ncbi:MAG TPA: HEAT repeat domain-containing protein [Gammaproteobacteria bacterium]
MRKRGTVSTLRLLAATAFAPLLASAQSGAPPISSIDIYGSSVFDSAAVRAEFEPDLMRFIELGWRAGFGSNSAPANAAELEAEMEATSTKIRSALESRVPLAYFNIGVTLDFGPPQQVEISIDVVEKADEARRMPFHSAPTQRLDDPGGVLALWAEYQRKMYELALAGAPMLVDDSNCPVLHCIAPFDLPDLAPFLPRLNAGAEQHEDALYAVARSSADAEERAMALFVLAHTKDVQRLVPLLANAIYDPNGGVRNNAMRVLMFLAQKRPDADFPVRDLIAALDFPTSADRNKAAYTVAALAEQPKYRATIRADAVPAALHLLRVEKPNNHDPAYTILKQVSGEEFGERDYAAWERWAAAR